MDCIDIRMGMQKEQRNRNNDSTAESSRVNFSLNENNEHTDDFISFPYTEIEAKQKIQLTAKSFSQSQPQYILETIDQ